MEETGTLDFSSADLMAVAPSCVAETVVKLPLNYNRVSQPVNPHNQVIHTTAVGVRLALIMYASLTSFFCCAEALNCLWILAKRCCGLEAILMDVRRADDDIVTGEEEIRYDRGGIAAQEVGSSESNNDCHMAATFRSFMRSSAAACRGTWGRVAEALRGFGAAAGLSRTCHMQQQ